MSVKKGRSLADRLLKWDRLVSGIQELLADLPHMEEDLRELEQLAGEIKRLSIVRQRYIARTRQATSRMTTLGRKADRISGRIGAGLRSKHGFDATILIKFGFTPRRPPKPMHEEGPLEPERPDEG